MSETVTIVIPTIPERSHLLAQAVESVHAQTAACEYLIGEDTEHNGCVATVNALAECVQTDWLMRLDDDDLLEEDHISVIEKWLDDDADIVYSWCRIEGGGELHPEDQFQVRLQNAYGWDHLHVVNWIPCTAAIRTELWRELGGYREVEMSEDWDFWIRALDAGARFRCIPTVTWTYRMSDAWKHRSLDLKERDEQQQDEARQDRGTDSRPA